MLAVELQMTCVMLQQKVCLDFARVQGLPQTETGQTLTNMAKEISRQSNVEAVAKLLLGAFS